MAKVVITMTETDIGIAFHTEFDPPAKKNTLSDVQALALCVLDYIESVATVRYKAVNSTGKVQN